MRDFSITEKNSRKVKQEYYRMDRPLTTNFSTSPENQNSDIFPEEKQLNSITPKINMKKLQRDIDLRYLYEIEKK